MPICLMGEQTDRKEVGAPFGLFADGRRGVGGLGYIDT